MNAGWYLLSVIATYWLLLTEWRMSSVCHKLLIFCVLDDAKWWLISSVCYCHLLPADLMPAQVCRLLHTPALLLVIWCWMLTDIFSLLLPPAFYWLLMTVFPVIAWSQLLLLVDTSCLLMPRRRFLLLTAAGKRITSNIYCLLSDASCMLFLLLVT